MKIRKVPNIRSIILCMLLSLPMCMVCGSNAIKDQKYSQTASCDKNGHSLKDDVCQICGHGFFSYRTNNGKIVTLNNIDFGANIVSHSVVNGECTIECDGPITKIPDNAFSSKGLKGELLRIPRTVTYIGTKAFYYNIDLFGFLIIPNSVTEIGERAFYKCGFNGSLTLSNNLTKIGNSAFSNCGFTGNLTIPNSVTEIGPYAFYMCSGFNGNLTLSDNLKSIGDNAFSSCGKLKAQITFPATLEKIGTDVFSGTTNIKSVKFQSLPQGINNIKQKDVILNDASFISDQATGKVNNISYSRTISNPWGSLVLPYSLTLTGNEPYSLYAIESISTVELVLSRLNGEVAAGTPCMVKRNGEQKEMTFTANNATLNMTIQPIAVKDLYFQGTYHTTEVTDGYIIRNGLLWDVAKLKKASPETEAIMVGPFRSWLDGTTNGKAKLSIRVDDSATGIDNPISSLNADDVEYYDLNGRRLAAPQQGINIMKRGNKTMKVIIK
ncbi:leucine-rich repeat domain-containing protein [uncultured Prevotella sp.]|uniref:leucine-rich repeat domain-containing protein n=1 Tax=uncultured Prevotella sp. TaxID=159272 RepID=UPI00262F9932|nr:leucine-rich repeat domain-containing protein [uncultured Prevotella sp.]